MERTSQPMRGAAHGTDPAPVARAILTGCGRFAGSTLGWHCIMMCPRLLEHGRLSVSGAAWHGYAYVFRARFRQ